VAGEHNCVHAAHRVVPWTPLTPPKPMHCPWPAFTVQAHHYLTPGHHYCGLRPPWSQGSATADAAGLQLLQATVTAEAAKLAARSGDSKPVSDVERDLTDQMVCALPWHALAGAPPAIVLLAPPLLACSATAGCGVLLVVILPHRQTHRGRSERIHSVSLPPHHANSPLATTPR
jgi:hypothetical protein